MRKLGRFSPRRRLCSRGFAWSQWVVLALVWCGWAAFLGLFIIGLRWSFIFSTNGFFTVAQPAFWFYLACGPAFLEALARAVRNNIELWEPGSTIGASVAAAAPPWSPRSDYKDHKNAITALGASVPIIAIGSPTAIEIATQPDYVQLECTNSLSMWRRIVANQLQARPYRLLVHPYPVHWFTDVYQVRLLYHIICSQHHIL